MTARKDVIFSAQKPGRGRVKKDCTDFGTNTGGYCTEKTTRPNSSTIFLIFLHKIGTLGLLARKHFPFSKDVSNPFA